jgi:4-hydroxy 2-oxovalerate aldolase
MVRIAIDPKEFQRALILAEAVKKMGFEVGFNVMYMSKWKTEKEFLNLLPEVKDISDYFYMVDSYGGVYPTDVIETIEIVREKAGDISLGFHGHNNLELALINTLTAIDNGCSMVDATITGMGRGAGNVKTELLLTALNAKSNLEVDFNPLSKVVDGFTELQKEYEWGTNLPYMVSGAHSLPQKDVMDWVGKRFYSFNSIIRALQNKAKGVQDNLKLKALAVNSTKVKVILIGGGSSVNLHLTSVLAYLKNNEDVVLVHASSKHAKLFKHLKNEQIFCLVGNEGHRLEDSFEGNFMVNAICVLPPFPRVMGTYIPSIIENNAFELEKYDYTSSNIDSHTSIALQVIKELNPEIVFVIGYDGYRNDIVDQKAQELLDESNKLFSDFCSSTSINLVSIFETVYKIPQTSIY